MGDLIAPGSEQLRFGNFDNIEINKVSCIAINVNPQAIINEYGSNFMKYKLDPLRPLKLRMLCIQARGMIYSNLMTSLESQEPRHVCLPY